MLKAADAPAPALSFGNFADKVASPSGGFNFKAPEFNTGNQGLFGAPTKFGETADKKEGDKKKEDEKKPDENKKEDGAAAAATPAPSADGDGKKEGEKKKPVAAPEQVKEEKLLID